MDREETTSGISPVVVRPEPPPLGELRGEVTGMLRAWRAGDTAVMDRLMPVVYAELRRLAGFYMRAERGGHTLQPTALIHEAYLRLVEQRGLDWQSRAHFVAVAATMMRRVLLNHARAQQAEKRGSGEPLLPLDAVVETLGWQPAELITLDDAMADLTRTAPRLGQIVELRLFGGFSVVESARYLEVSTATVKRDWRLAKAWLRRQLSRESAIEEATG